MAAHAAKKADREEKKRFPAESENLFSPAEFGFSSRSHISHRADCFPISLFLEVVEESLPSFFLFKRFFFLGSYFSPRN